MNIKDLFEKSNLRMSGLLLTFGILLITLAALVSLMVVKSDRRIQHESDKAVNDYYLADLEAEKIYALLQAGETVPGVVEEDGIFRYSCPISEGRVLEVEVTCREGTWEILRWEAVEYEPDE